MAIFVLLLAIFCWWLSTYIVQVAYNMVAAIAHLPPLGFWEIALIMLALGVVFRVLRGK